MKNPVRIQYHVEAEQIPDEIVKLVERGTTEELCIHNLSRDITELFYGVTSSGSGIEDVNLLEVINDIDTVRQRLATFDQYLLDTENLIRGYLQLKLAEKEEKSIPNGEESENENAS